MTDPDDHDTIRVRTPRGSRGAAPPAAGDEKEAPAPREDKPGFNPFKFQRITLPPGLRADFFRWSKAARDEKIPEDTLPPNGGSDAPASRAQPSEPIRVPAGVEPDSMSPLGVNALPVRPLRGVVVGAVLVAIAGLLTLVVATLARGGDARPVSEVNATATTEAASAAKVPPTPAAAAGSDVAPPPTATAPVVPAAAPSEPRLNVSADRDPAVTGQPSHASRPKKAVNSMQRADPPHPQPASESGARGAPSESALDRPFSTPQ